MPVIETATKASNKFVTLNININYEKYHTNTALAILQCYDYMKI